MIFSAVLGHFLHRPFMDGAKSMTICRVNQVKLRQFSVVWGYRCSKIKALTFLSHQAVPDTSSTFWQDAKELTIKVVYLAPQYLAF